MAAYESATHLLNSDLAELVDGAAEVCCECVRALFLVTSHWESTWQTVQRKA